MITYEDDGDQVCVEDNEDLQSAYECAQDNGYQLKLNIKSEIKNVDEDKKDIPVEKKEMITELNQE